jgi:diguanylate cyclase (GGDEF)-like protein/putative nucleotidyltransferase with HDIG domain
MKHFAQPLTSWWFTTMVPVHTPPTTLMQREHMRKRRLLSIMLLACLILTLGYLVYMYIAAFTIQMPICLLSICSLLLALWLNRQGYLKSASLTFFFVDEATMFLGAQVTALSDPSILLWTCFVLTLFLVVLGLLVPPWITLLLAVLENLALFWYLCFLNRTQMLQLLSPVEFQHFLLYLCMCIYGNAFLGAYYAITTKKAVLQADRTYEVEQAHSALTEAYATIEKQAQTDSLIGLPNHRTIIAEIERELLHCQNSQRNCAIIFVDVDHFKQINDTWGHGAGDAVLCMVGQRLRDGVRNDDTVGRYGGEEFAILLTDIEQIEAVELAERLRCLLVDSPCMWKQDETLLVAIPITASFGVATYPLDGTTSKELIERADAAMYAAKQAGRNRVCLPDDEEEVAVSELNVSQQLTIETRTVQVLSTVASLHDQGTHTHALRMQDLAEATARMLGRSEEEVQLIRLAAQLHDIGKMGIPDAILHKPGPLTPEEWAVMQSHPRMGQQILTQAGGRLDLISHIVVVHHERWDGQGYPYGLAQQEIPLGARILSVVDSYDAMTSTRSYREACSAAQARAELQHCAGSQYDPCVVDAFLQVLQAPEPQSVPALISEPAKRAAKETEHMLPDSLPALRG